MYIYMAMAIGGVLFVPVAMYMANANAIYNGRAAGRLQHSRQ